MVTPVQKDSISPHVLVLYSVSQAEGRNVFVRIMNTSNCDIQLQAGQQIGEYWPLIDTLLPNLHEPSTANHTVSNNSPSVACTNFSQNQIKVELEAALSPSAKQNDRQILLQTHLKYSDVFHDSLGHTDVITHKIDTGDAGSTLGVCLMHIEKRLIGKLMKCLSKGSSRKVSLRGRPPLFW